MTTLCVTGVWSCCDCIRSQPLRGSIETHTSATVAHASLNPPWPSLVCVADRGVTRCFIRETWLQQSPTVVNHAVGVQQLARAAEDPGGVVAHSPLLVEPGHLDEDAGLDRLGHAGGGGAVAGDVGDVRRAEGPE